MRYLLIGFSLFLCSCQRYNTLIKQTNVQNSGDMLPLSGIPNGSFELWDILGPLEWEPTEQGNPAPFYTLAKVDGHTGNYAMQVNVYDLGCGVTNGVSFINRLNEKQYAGHYVKLSVWCKTSVSHTWRITFKTGETNVYGQYAQGTGEWEKIEVVGYVDASAPLFWIKIGCIVDDLKISSVIWDDAQIEIIS